MRKASQKTCTRLVINSDEGFGYGVRLQLVDHGDGTLQPYRKSFDVQFFQTTKGVAAHQLFLDLPAFLGTRFRLDATLSWSIDKFSPWYGPGNAAPEDSAN